MRETITLPPQLHVGAEPREGGGKQIDRKLPFKPYAALWTSTYSTAWETGWPWWLEENGFDYSWPGDKPASGWLMQPRECDVWLIENATDAFTFVRTFEGAQGVLGEPLVDWNAAAEDGIAAVRLTAPYDPAIRFGLAEGLGITFYAWDCESTAWMSWQFDSVEEVELPELMSEGSEDDD